MCNSRENTSLASPFPSGIREPGPDRATSGAKDDTVRFEIWGFLGRDIAADILDMIKPYFETRGEVILDLSAVHGIDSAGIAVLVEGLMLGAEFACGFRVVGINRPVKDVLVIAQIHSLFDHMEIQQLPGTAKCLHLKGVS